MTVPRLVTAYCSMSSEVVRNIDQIKDITVKPNDSADKKKEVAKKQK